MNHRFDSGISKVRSGKRRGNAVMFSLLTSMLLGFGALAVDIGYMRVTQTELSVAADAAAHGGVGYLRENWGDYASDMEVARSQTVLIAALNEANNSPVVIDPNSSNSLTGDVVLGEYDWDSATFVPSIDPDRVNAVQVRAHTSGLGAIFAPAAFGVNTLSTQAEAIAVKGRPTGAGAVACFLPIAIPYCEFQSSDGLDEEHALDDLDGDGIADKNLVEFKLQPATGDNLGWAGFSSGFGATDVKNQFTSNCSGGTVRVGDSVYLKNGDMGVLKAVRDIIVASSTSWNASLWGTQPRQDKDSSIPRAEYGHTLEGPAILFEAGPEYCDSDPKTGSWTPASGALIKGFAWVSIYDIVDPSGKGTKSIRARIEVMSDRSFGTDSGGPDFGIEASTPDLIVR